MENEDSIFVFLNMIGAILGPVSGVLIVHFYLINRCKVDIDRLYFDLNDPNHNGLRFNFSAYVATILGVVVSLLGFIPKFQVISDFSWFIGFIIAGVSYIILYLLEKRFRKNKGEKANEI